MRPWYFNLRINLKLALAKLLARWLFWRKYTWEPLLATLPSARSFRLSKKIKRTFVPRKRRSWKEKSFFSYATRWRFNEFWRTLKQWRHRAKHKKTRLKKANQKVITRYLRQQQKIVLRRHHPLVGALVRTLISFSLTAGILFGAWWCYENIFNNLPLVSELIEKKQPMTTKILDRNNHLLFSIYEDENRTPISLDQVSPYLIQATIAIEDRTFYQHNGFDLKAFARAFMKN
ncbi:MAG: transglycosylase domain-containing protein, partial [bacterium]|nr:transglycosylase domain-containing protein [bacterium]